MSYTPLRTDYTDVHWEGNKKYVITDNEDGTHGIEDVTEYSNEQNSFFGALDANTINAAVNDYVLASTYHHFATSSSTGAALTAELQDGTTYLETTGRIVYVKFSAAVNRTAATTLNVANAGARAIQINGAAISANNPLRIPVNGIVAFMLEGTTYRVLNISNALLPQLLFTVATGAVVTATCGNFTATATSASNLAVLTLPSFGAWNITAKTSGGVLIDTYTLNVDTVKRYIMTLPAKMSGLDWATINSVAQSGNIPASWLIGDEKDIQLNTGEILTFQIYGFNHDDLQSGGKAKITFGMKNCMNATRQMNGTNTNVGGFTGSAMWTWLNSTFKNSLPQEVRDVIKPVNKRTSAGNDSSVINTNVMDVFLFSEAELFDTITYSKPGEGQKYPIFADNNSRIKKLTNGAGAVTGWWERSPRSGSTTDCCFVHSGGATSYGTASGSCGVVAGFCV